MLKRVFGYTDIHWTHRDERAVEVAMKAQAYFQPHHAVIGGDLADCGPFSSHPKIDKTDQVDDWIRDELEPCQLFLNYVQDNTLEHTSFVEGNHEHRVERVAANGGKAWKAVYPLVSPRHLFPRGRKDFTYIPFSGQRNPLSGFCMVAPDVRVVHGWAANKYAANKHLELSRTQSIIYNHAHRRQEHSTRDPWTNRQIFSMCAGCLCNLEPFYGHNGAPSDWSHGFWVGYVDKHHRQFYPVTIENGYCIMPDGKEIRA